MPGPCNGAGLDSLAKWTAPLPTREKVLNATATEDRTPVEAEPATV
jgi:hypothetical protein